MDNEKESKLLEEYKDLSNNMRHYSNVQFAQLTVLITVTAGLIALLFIHNPYLTPFAKDTIRYSGILITIFFWMIIFSSTYLWGKFICHAAELENILSFKQYSQLIDAPKFRIRPGSCGLHLICFFLLVFWIMTITCTNLCRPL